MCIHLLLFRFAYFAGVFKLTIDSIVEGFCDLYFHCPIDAFHKQMTLTPLDINCEMTKIARGEVCKDLR